MTTPVIGLPELEAAQGQKYLTVNQTFRRLDVLVNLTVFNRTVTAPPGSPSDGHRYIVAATATGDFVGQENNVAMFLGSDWIFFTPSEGWRAYDQGADEFIVFNGTSWVLAGLSSSALSDGSTTLVGVNATPDSTNRLSVSAPGVLFNNEGDDFTLTLNKDTAADDLQILFQTGFSTRAQVGMLTNDDLVFKVSPDGSTFFTGITIDKDTGNVAIGAGSDANNKLLVSGNSALFTSSGDFSFVFNKGAVADDASITFQTNFSGRALIGLLGDDNFGFTVSDDGSAYTQAMIIDAATASVSLPQHPRFSAYTNFQQYNAADAWFQVGANVTEHNDQSAVASGVFTAPHAGYYTFGGGVEFELNSSAPDSVSLGFSIDGANPLPQHTARQIPGVGGLTLAITNTFKLAQGDTVSLMGFFKTNDGFFADDRSYFWGTQIA